MKTKNTGHMPVMVDEVLSALKLNDLAHLKNEPNEEKEFIDATVGVGGHTIEILKKGGRVLAIDTDEKMLKLAKAAVSKACPTLYDNGVQGLETYVVFALGNFEDIADLAKENEFKKVYGVLFDLGINSVHLNGDDRGFSFKDPTSSLDMRLSTDLAVTAADLVNALPQDKLVKLFETVLDKGECIKLTRVIIEYRGTAEIKTVGDFIAVVKSSGIGDKKGKKHIATKPMMALRIAVNSELEVLKRALPSAFSLLQSGGILAVISFHSGEDRIVKHTFSELAQEGKGVLAEYVAPSQEEIINNPRARSAKLRIIEKI